MLDLLVIGAGLSGLCAALTAVQAGRTVRIITKGMGVTHWHAATIDLLGYLPGDAQSVSDPLAAIERLDGNHPYRLVGVDGIANALQTFQQWLATAGLPYHTHDEGEIVNRKSKIQNLLLPSPVGALRPTLMAPTAQWSGRTTLGSPLLIVGFEGMRDFYPALIAENLNKQGIPARAAFLPFSTISDRRDSNTVQLAESLDNAARRHHLGAALKKLVQPSERIGLPAILGLEQHSLTLAELQNQVGATVFEIPTLPPSVPGIRLYRALAGQLQKLGVRIETNMEAIGFHAEHGRIQWVETATSARPLKHRAQNFVLATGGVLGGGFSSDYTGNFREVVFDLPLHAPIENLADRRQWVRPHFFDPVGQPIFKVGVAVNAKFQPVDASGAVVYQNLWAAGGVLANADGIQERSLEGVAVVTGIHAGKL